MIIAEYITASGFALCYPTKLVTATEVTITDTPLENTLVKRVLTCDTPPSELSFEAQGNLYEIISLNTSFLTSMDMMFYNCSNLSKFNLTSCDTRNVVTMNNTFYNLNRNVTALDLSSFNTSKVTSMKFMFAQISARDLNLDLTSFDTTSLVDATGMFYQCQAKTINTSSFRTPNLVKVNKMFSSAGFVDNINVSGFSTSKITNMDEMFCYCGSKVLDISSFDMSNVTSAYWMFGSPQMTKLILGKFNISKLGNMKQMFYALSQLTHIDLSNCDLSTTNNLWSTFEYCSKLKSIGLPSMNMNLLYLNSMFSSCAELETLDLTPFNPVQNAITSSMLSGAENIKTIINLNPKNKVILTKGPSVNLNKLTRVYYHPDNTAFKEMILSLVDDPTKIEFFKLTSSTELTLPCNLNVNDELVWDEPLGRYVIKNETNIRPTNITNQLNITSNEGNTSIIALGQNGIFSEVTAKATTVI